MRGQVWAIILLLSLLSWASPATAASEDTANVLFEASTGGPVVAMAASLDGTDVLAVDKSARFTFLGNTGAIERSWTAPKTGHLAKVDPTLGEIDPTAIGVAVTPDGDLWGAAIAYADTFPGKFYGFGHWSDAPIWTYTFPQPQASQDADQPVIVTGGGPYYAVGTQKGIVLLFTAEADSGTTKHPHRTYTRDNQGNPFGTIHDLALSRDGTRILIATGATDEAALHLFSDTFFLSSFRRIKEPVYETAISADGTRGIAITGTGATTRAHFLDLTNGTTLWESSIGSTVNDAALSPDGRLTALATAAGNVHLYADNGDPFDRQAIAQHYLAAPVTSVAIADNGRAVAAATDDGIAYYLDRTRPEPLWSYDAETPLVSLSLSTDERYLNLGAAGADNGRIIVTGAKHDIAYIAPPSPRLLPGVATTVSVEVANNGNRIDEVTVRADGLPTGWSSTTHRLLLAPGEQRTAPVEITVAKGQRDGSYQFPLLVESTGQVQRTSLTARVPEVASARVSEAWRFDHAVPGGAPAAFLLTVENLGNVPNNVALGYAGLPAGWKAEFDGDVEFRLQPGEDRQVSLLVHAPRDAVVGREAWFDLVLAGQHGEWRTPVTILITDGTSYHYALRVEIESERDRDPDIAPLQDRLRERVEGDLEKAEEQRVKKAAAAQKRQTKDSPGVGLVPIVAIAALAGLVVRRRIVISSPETRAERWSFPHLVKDGSEGAAARLQVQLLEDEQDEP